MMFCGQRNCQLSWQKEKPTGIGELLRQEYSLGQEFRNRDDSGIRNGRLQEVLISGKEQVSVCV